MGIFILFFDNYFIKISTNFEFVNKFHISFLSYSLESFQITLNYFRNLPVD